MGNGATETTYTIWLCGWVCGVALVVLSPPPLVGGWYGRDTATIATGSSGDLRQFRRPVVRVTASVSMRQAQTHVLVSRHRAAVSGTSCLRHAHVCNTKPDFYSEIQINEHHVRFFFIEFGRKCSWNWNIILVAVGPTTKIILFVFPCIL